MVLNQLVFHRITNSISCQLSSSTFNISGSELGIAVSASVVPSSGSDISDVFGDSPFGSKNAYVYNYFEQGQQMQQDTLLRVVQK